MKILHVANFGFRKQALEFYNTDRKLSYGFGRNGHLVYDYSLNDMARFLSVFKSKKFGCAKVNKDLISTAVNLKPDFLLLGHCDILTTATLEIIKSKLPNIKIALWYVDALYEENKTHFIKELSPYLDAVFATTGGEYLKNCANTNIIRAYLPNVVCPETESNKSFLAEPWQQDFIFCGTIGDDNERLQFLRELASAFNGDKQTTRAKINFRFYGAFGENTIRGAPYYEVLATSQMGLNYSRRNDIELYSSDRIAQLTGNGVLTFCPRIPDFEIIYQPDEVIYFNDTQDLIEKVNYYKDNPQKSCAIARAGWEKSHKNYTVEKIATYIENLVFEKEVPEYNWVNHIHLGAN